MASVLRRCAAVVGVVGQLACVFLDRCQYLISRAEILKFGMSGGPPLAP